MVPGVMEKPKQDEVDDFDLVLSPLTTDALCFYCLYRLDTSNSLGYEYLLYSYINDSAPVRNKMIYASTLSALKVKIISPSILHK